MTIFNSAFSGAQIEARLLLANTAAQPANVTVFTKNQSVLPGLLTSGATVNTNASLSNNFKLVLGVNAILANPTNLTAGMVLTFEIVQDATGSRTLTYGTVFKFPGGTTPVLSTAANAVDVISGVVNQAGTAIFANITKGFA